MNHSPKIAALYMGVSLNGGTPKTPQQPKMVIFSRKNPWLLGTTILGTPHMFSFFPSDNKGGYFQKLKNSQDFDLWQVMPEVLKQEMEMMEDVDGNQSSGKLTS